MKKMKSKEVFEEMAKIKNILMGIAGKTDHSIFPALAKLNSQVDVCTETIQQTLPCYTFQMQCNKNYSTFGTVYREKQKQVFLELLSESKRTGDGSAVKIRISKA